MPSRWLLLLTALAHVDAGQDGLHVVLAPVALGKAGGADTDALVWCAPAGADVAVSRCQQAAPRGCKYTRR